MKSDKGKIGKGGVEIWALDAAGERCALAVGGLVRYVGERGECERRAQILMSASDRGNQDLMLVRALR